MWASISIEFQLREQVGLLLIIYLCTPFPKGKIVCIVTGARSYLAGLEYWRMGYCHYVMTMTWQCIINKLVILAVIAKLFHYAVTGLVTRTPVLC